jgi:hypothetical protein
MSRISLDNVKSIYEKLKIDPTDIPYVTMQKGMEVELEHGMVDPKTNITDDDLIMTAKIALAHLKEGIDYYELLEEMEKELKARSRVPDYFRSL